MGLSFNTLGIENFLMVADSLRRSSEKAFESKKGKILSKKGQNESRYDWKDKNKLDNNSANSFNGNNNQTTSK